MDPRLRARPSMPAAAGTTTCSPCTGAAPLPRTASGGRLPSRRDGTRQPSQRSPMAPQPGLCERSSRSSTARSRTRSGGGTCPRAASTCCSRPPGFIALPLAGRVVRCRGCLAEETGAPGRTSRASRACGQVPRMTRCASHVEAELRSGCTGSCTPVVCAGQDNNCESPVWIKSGRHRIHPSEPF